MGKTKKKQTSLNFIPASAAALEGKNLCDPFEELVLFQSLLESTLFLLRDPRVNIEVASQTSRPVSRSNTTFYMAGGPSDGQACRHAAQERSGDSAVAHREALQPQASLSPPRSFTLSNKWVQNSLVPPAIVTELQPPMGGSRPCPRLSGWGGGGANDHPKGSAGDEPGCSGSGASSTPSSCRWRILQVSMILHSSRILWEVAAVWAQMTHYYVVCCCRFFFWKKILRKG